MTDIKTSYSIVLFDWDGCIANSLEQWLIILEREIARYYPSITKHQLITDNIIGNFAYIANYGITDVDGFGRTISTLIMEHAGDISLNKEALETLTTLFKKKKKLGIVTSSPRVFLEEQIKTHNLRELFDVVITQDDVKRLKPDAEPVQKALEHFGASKDLSVMVGDSKKDIGAANAAGITSILYYPELNSQIYDRDYLLALNADYYIRSFSEVIDIVG